MSLISTPLTRPLLDWFAVCYYAAGYPTAHCAAVRGTLYFGTRDAQTRAERASRLGVAEMRRENLQQLRTIAVEQVPHGNYRYIQYGCRCVECKRLHAEAVLSQKRSREERLGENFDRLPHGTTSTYGNWGCRCDPCVAAQSAKNREGRERRKREQERAS